MNENMPSQRNGHKGNSLSMKKCALLAENVQASNEVKQDWVIWSRPDIFFFNFLENILEIDNKFLYFPSHDNHLLGLYDRFCMGPRIQFTMLIFDYFSQTWYENFMKMSQS